MSAKAPFDEALVLPRALEILAKDHPEKTWMTVPNDPRLATGWRNITYGELGQAVDGFALWAQRTIGISDVVAYMGVNDIRYPVAEIGIMKMGRTAFLPSPRNSTKGNVSLFEATACNVLVHSDSVDSQVEALRLAMPSLETCLLPSFDQLRREGVGTGWRGHYSMEEDTTTLILHTSGSTGPPRPIGLTNGALATFKHVSDLALPPGLRTQPGAAQPFGKAMFVMTPFFHESGTIVILRSILCRGPVVLPPSDQPPTAELILKILDQTRPSLVSLFPSILEDLVNLPGGLDALAKADLVTFGGAPLAQEVGDKICEVTYLHSGLGSTEAGVLPTVLSRDRRDWNYSAWAPESGVEMQLRDDGLYECVIKPFDRKYQKILHTYPDITEYRTKDLFEQHLTKPGLWRFRGRADDILVLSNGEKLNPVDFEKLVELHPLVKGAIVVGQNKFQAGLLIELNWELLSSQKAYSEILEELWPTIEQANQTMPKHGVVWKSKVALATKDKPFARTSTKGNVVRTSSTELYSEEIEMLYANELVEVIGHLAPGASLSTVESFLRSIVQATGMSMPLEKSNDQDLFANGMDSLQTMQLASMINHSPAYTISASEIYSHPTISSLAAYMVGKAATTQASATSDRQKEMSDMAEKYTTGLTPQKNRHHQKATSHSVLLTGSTGSLGCLLLHELMQTPNIAQIFCLNRAADGEVRQAQQFAHNGFQADFSKVTFLTSKDFSEHSLGLSSDIYENLTEVIDQVILNAWTVDFNKTLQSFEGLVAGIRKFVDFSIASRHQVHITMISSIASVGGWPAIHDHDEVEVPERVISDNRVPAPGGYGESKHVAALVLAAAAKVGVTSTIIRVGQLAGPAEEDSQIKWNSREWFPSMIATSKALGVLPSHLGGSESIDWVPIDLAAQAIVEITQTVPENSDENPRVFHVVNPNTTTWTNLLPAVKTCLGKEVSVVKYSEWLSKLRDIPMTKANAERVPGIKLLDFFEGFAVEQEDFRLATTKTIEVSLTMREMKPVSTQLMEKWIRQI